MNRRTVLLVVAAILMPLLAAVPSTQAEELPVAKPVSGDRGGILLVGTVIEAEEHELQVHTPDGTWKVLFGEDTLIRFAGVVEATWEDIRIGKAIMVRGRVTGVDTIEAKLITAPRRRANPLGQLLSSLKRARRLQGSLRGEVVGVGEDQITVRAGDREVVINVDDGTVYRVPGVKDPGLSDIQTGQLVVAGVPRGENEAAKLVAVVTQTQMRRIAAQARLLRTVRRAVGAMSVRGEVVAVEGDGLVVSTPHGQVTANATEHTRFWVQGKEEATLADISVGDVVTVMGRPDLSCPISAIGIRVMPERPRPEE